MNNHIKELANKAWDENIVSLHPKVEKFVELLIAETVEQCMQEHWAIIAGNVEPDTSEFNRGVRCGRKMMASDLAAKIKTHFGVK